VRKYIFDTVGFLVIVGFGFYTIVNHFEYSIVNNIEQGPYDALAISVIVILSLVAFLFSKNIATRVYKKTSKIATSDRDDFIMLIIIAFSLILFFVASSSSYNVPFLEVFFFALGVGAQAEYILMIYKNKDKEGGCK